MSTVTIDNADGMTLAIWSGSPRVVSASLTLADGTMANLAGPAAPVVLGSDIALGKPTTASSVQSSAFIAANATDGKTSTRWASAFSDPQWLQVDLGATYSVNRVKLAWETAYGKAFQIQVSDDAVNWTTIYTATKASGGTQDINAFLSVPGRYVRMYGTQRGTGWGYSLYAFEVYGMPAAVQPPAPPPVVPPAPPTPPIIDIGDTTVPPGPLPIPTTPGTVYALAAGQQYSVGNGMTVNVPRTIYKSVGTANYGRAIVNGRPGSAIFKPYADDLTFRDLEGRGSLQFFATPQSLTKTIVSRLTIDSCAQVVAVFSGEGGFLWGDIGLDYLTLTNNRGIAPPWFARTYAAHIDETGNWFIGTSRATAVRRVHGPVVSGVFANNIYAGLSNLPPITLGMDIDAYIRQAVKQGDPFDSYGAMTVQNEDGSGTGYQYAWRQRGIMVRNNTLGGQLTLGSGIDSAEIMWNKLLVHSNAITGEYKVINSTNVAPTSLSIHDNAAIQSLTPSPDGHVYAADWSFLWTMAGVTYPACAGNMLVGPGKIGPGVSRVTSIPAGVGANL